MNKHVSDSNYEGTLSMSLSMQCSHCPKKCQIARDPLHTTHWHRLLEVQHIY